MLNGHANHKLTYFETEVWQTGMRQVKETFHLFGADRSSYDVI